MIQSRATWSLAKRAFSTSPQIRLPYSSSDLPSYRIQMATPDDHHLTLKVKWDDGLQSQFPYIWLRDCAPPANESLTTKNLGVDGRRLSHIFEMDLKVQPEKLEVLPSGQGVLIEWPPYHEVSYSSDWLRINSPALTTVPKMSDVIHWGRPEMKVLGGIPKLSPDQISSELLRLEINQNMSTYGIVHIPRAVGQDKEHIIRDALGLGETQFAASYYAKCFTKFANGLHTGIPFEKPIPNLCILKFPKKIGAGHFQFVDGFRIADILYQTQPFIYHFLRSTNVNYGVVDRRFMGEVSDSERVENGSPVLVEEDSHKSMKMVVFNDVCRAPIQPVKPEAMKDLYAALKAFSKVCYEKENVVDFTPQEGDMIILDNYRVLHGATAFHSGGQDGLFVEELFYHWRRN